MSSEIVPAMRSAACGTNVIYHANPALSKADRSRPSAADVARMWVTQPEQQLDECRLAAPGRPDDADDFAEINRKGDVAEDELVADIRERHPFSRDGANGIRRSGRHPHDRLSSKILRRRCSSSIAGVLDDTETSAPWSAWP